jgi:uncharacterized protein
MTENNPIWQHPAIYFITRLFILIGMMMVFGGIAYSIAIYTCKPFFGLDFMSNPTLMNDFTNPAYIPALKYIQLMGSIGAFIFPAWYFCKAIQRKPENYLKLTRILSIPEIIVSLVLIFASMPFISWLIYINGLITFPSGFASLEASLKSAEELAAKITLAFLQADTLSVLWYNILVIAVIPAIGEEFLFRGVLQNFVKQVTSNKHLSVWLIAIIFSAFHGQFYGFIPRVCLGAILGYAYLFTGNLWVSIAIHFINNAFAVICSYGPVAAKLPYFMADNFVFESWLINAGSACMVICLIVLFRYLGIKKMWYHE